MGYFTKKPETVLKSTYDTLQEERDTLEREVKRLQEQAAALVPVRKLARDATALLDKINELGANRKVTVTLRKEIDTFMGEASAAGLIEEKGKQNDDGR